MIPKISIIVPVYNVDEYLETCVESILHQTFTDFELILVNDGSTDSSGKICDKYKCEDNRIHVIHKQNGGVSSARNIGIDESVGKYIQFIDPDDYIDNQLLECGYKTIESDITDIIVFGVKYEEYGVNLNTEKLPSYNLNNLEYSINYKIVNLIREELFGFVWNKLYKSKIIKENKLYFDESIKLSEDEKFNFDYYYYVKNMSILNKSYYHYVKYGMERINLSSKNIKDIYIKDIIFKSCVKVLEQNNKEFISESYLLERSFAHLYEEYYKICFSKLCNKEKQKNLGKLKNSYFYKYFNNSHKNMNEKIFLYIIQLKSMCIFKLYNKIFYFINK